MVFLSLYKPILCPIHWIIYVLAYLDFMFEFQSSFSTAHNGPVQMARSAQTHKSISFILIVWSTLYIYLWLDPQKGPIMKPLFWSFWTKSARVENEAAICICRQGWKTFPSVSLSCFCSGPRSPKMTATAQCMLVFFA